jgi:[ribosomal protein S5]-alanine N-acetyltransferase
LKNLPVLRGEKVYIGPMPEKEAFYSEYLSWLNSQKVMQGTGSETECTLSEVRELLEEWKNNERNFTFCVFDCLTNEPIGDVCLRYNDADEEYPEVTVMIAKGFGKGRGFEAEKLVIEWGFKDLNLEAICGSIYKDNIASIKINKKLGFDFYKEIIEELTGKAEYLIILRREDWQKMQNDFM